MSFYYILDGKVDSQRSETEKVLSRYKKHYFFKNDSLCDTPLCDSCNANKNTGYEARRLMLTLKNNKESGEEYHKRERSTEKKEK